MRCNTDLIELPSRQSGLIKLNITSKKSAAAAAAAAGAAGAAGAAAAAGVAGAAGAAGAISALKTGSNDTVSRGRNTQRPENLSTGIIAIWLCSPKNKILQGLF